MTVSLEPLVTPLNNVASCYATAESCGEPNSLRNGHKKRQRRRKQERKVVGVSSSLVGLSTIEMRAVEPVADFEWASVHPCLRPDAPAPELFAHSTDDHFCDEFLTAQAQARIVRSEKKKRKQISDRIAAERARSDLVIASVSEVIEGTATTEDFGGRRDADLAQGGSCTAEVRREADLVTTGAKKIMPEDRRKDGVLVGTSAAAPSVGRAEQRILASPCENRLLETGRARKKRLQIECFAQLLGTMCGTRVVEFGCGAGNLSLPLAAIFPSKQFILLDMKPLCLEFARVRANLAQLTNVEFHVGKIEEMDLDFDIGLALHVCGAATDYAMEKCLRAKAGFIVCPCCIGKIKAGTVQYPRSTWLRSIISEERYVSDIASVADHNGVGEAHREAKLVIEKDRKVWAEEHGYACDFFRMPVDSGPKRDIIVGTLA